jgi:hypothetical protein
MGVSISIPPSRIIILLDWQGLQDFPMGGGLEFYLECFFEEGKMLLVMSRWC